MNHQPPPPEPSVQLRNSVSLLSRPIFALSRACGWISSASLIALAGLVITDVVGRAFNAPLSSGSDIGAMLMVSLIFFAISGTQVDKDHVSMDALVAVFPPLVKALADRLSLVICVVVGGYLSYGTILAAIKSFERGEMALGALQLPLWPAKAIIAFGICLYTLVLVSQLFGANPSRREQDCVPPEGAE